MSNQKLLYYESFEELKVWQKAVELAIKIYEITKMDPFNKDFGLRDQMRRASVSILISCLSDIKRCFVK